jgi:precorrin-3B synthase
VPAAVRSRPDACPGVFAPHDAADGALARIRLPGGAIDAAALRAVADCADDLGDGRLHLTSRGNLQLRGLSRSSALSARLADAGLLPSATHERVRNVLASPLAGIAGDPVARVQGAPATTVGTRASESCDVRGLAAELDRALCARPGLAALPGRFLFALDDGRGDVAAEGPDLCWRAPGTLLVAGVPAAEVAVADAVAALLDAAETFLTLRAADGGGAWRAAELADGPARIAAALTSHASAPAARSCEPAPEAGPGLQQGGPAPVRLQQGHPAAIPLTPAFPRAATPGPVVRDDGGVALVVAPLLGELTSAQARLLADTGPTAVVTPWRTIVLPDPAVSAAALATAGLVVEPGPAADVSACAGRPGCAKALADVRADALAAVGHLPAGRIHVSGCARRCGAPRGPHVDAVALAGGGYLVDGIMRTGLTG